MMFFRLKFNIFRVILMIFLCIPMAVTAQTKYLAELGITGGTALHWGDDEVFSKSNISPAGGFIFKYNPDDRFTTGFEFNSANMTGIFNGNKYSNPVKMFDFRVAFNFLEFPAVDFKLYSSNITTYISSGISFANVGKTLNPEFNWPVGFGFRMKLQPRLNLFAEYTYRIFLNADNIEGIPALNNPLSLNGSNVFNNDRISTFSIGLSYDFMEKECDCMKNKEK